MLQGFKLDQRSISLFRIILSILLIYDLYLKFSDFDDFYSESGVYPLSLSMQWLHKSAFSFHFMSTVTLVNILIIMFEVYFYFKILIGHRTYSSIFFSIMFLISLHNRNPLILHGGDEYLRCLLFLSFFLSLNYPSNTSNNNNNNYYY